MNWLNPHGRAYCLVWCMTQVDYKALGSLPGAHETLIPFETTRQQIFFVASQRGESDCHRVPKAPGGFKGGRGGCGKPPQCNPRVYLFPWMLLFILDKIYSICCNALPSSTIADTKFPQNHQNNKNSKEERTQSEFLRKAHGDVRQDIKRVWRKKKLQIKSNACNSYHTKVGQKTGKL